MMCDIISISTEKVIGNDDNCGEAQYLQKNTQRSFWNKMENDCEKLFDFLSEYNKTKEWEFKMQGSYFTKYHGIQFWCTDMWGLFWNAILYSEGVKISKGFDFCWATSNIVEWNKKKDMKRKFQLFVITMIFLSAQPDDYYFL